VVGDEHYNTARQVSQRYSAIRTSRHHRHFGSGWSEDDRVTVARARKLERFLSQPFFVAEVFTGSPGKYVKLEETIKGFQMILSGQLDDLPNKLSTWSAFDDDDRKAGKLKG